MDYSIGTNNLNNWTDKIFYTAKHKLPIRINRPGSYATIKEHLYDAECGNGNFAVKNINISISNVSTTLTTALQNNYVKRHLGEKIEKEMNYDAFNCLWGAALHKKDIFDNIHSLRYDGNIDYTCVLKNPHHILCGFWTEIINCDLIPKGLIIAMENPTHYCRMYHDDVQLNLRSLLFGHRYDHFAKETVIVSKNYGFFIINTEKIGACYNGS